MTARRPDKYRLIGRLAVPMFDLLEWARWYETAERCVMRTKVGPMTVSTVFLALDHNSSDAGDAILFETMILGTVDEDYQVRCETWAQAERMHAAAVAHADKLLVAAAALMMPPEPEP